ncbi:hypothetical protein M378DRAFT_17624 [Amanita muscaria Koide BX008]|uniref:Uncharacterized protein n=1 Tax=Amanita muscaria (strain Koide BX008) TaxID=946122 RepID=A0A0C2RZJ3_AMAMK|nr:hypothetical protein M378DRAFT_17624 [Amanita muscaria Koide BX008]
MAAERAETPSPTIADQKEVEVDDIDDDVKMEEASREFQLGDDDEDIEMGEADEDVEWENQMKMLLRSAMGNANSEGVQVNNV